MNTVNDPFVHHPELRGRITDPARSFFRDFDGRDFFGRQPGLGWVVDLLRSDEQRAESRARTLDGRQDDDLWVFAYGSLMWDPAFEFQQVRRARLEGYARRFILKDIYGGRGSRQQPGLMAALDKGAGCDGLIFRIARDRIKAETDIIWRREMVFPSYIPTFVSVQAGGDSFEALTFVADREADAMHSDLSHSDQVAFLATGYGFLGSSLEYLENIVSHFSALNIVDKECSTLLQDARAYGRMHKASAES